MKVSEYFIDFLVDKGVTDVFGIPGGVVLDLLYAIDKSDKIEAHLSYHEQAAALEACGYSQFHYKLGVVYATRGPGFTNLITGIAEAFSESLPVMFVTAHSGNAVGHTMRFEKDQELDTVSMVRNITKYACVIDDVKNVKEEVHKAYMHAVSGRKGPVLLDFSADLWRQEIQDAVYVCNYLETTENNLSNSVEDIVNCLYKAKRPIILVGDGISQANAVDRLIKFSDMINIPVLSSRCSQDVGIQCKYYYGYVGSHGIRYSNFIFSKADCVIAIGNRMSFPVNSKSFGKALENKTLIRIDIDPAELSREIPNTIAYKADAGEILECLIKRTYDTLDVKNWLFVCEELKQSLMSYDLNIAINNITEMFNILTNSYGICCDVGNNEFWVSRAYAESNNFNRIIYSKSFGVLGCGIAKAIGVYYASKMPVICYIGDQGFQLNIQELQFIVQEQLPIYVVVLNNKSSGMIKSREKIKYGEHYVHTTRASGYGVPDIEKVAASYGIQYYKYDKNIDTLRRLLGMNHPLIIEMELDEKIDLEPSLPAGNECQRMSPEIEKNLYDELSKL